METKWNENIPPQGVLCKEKSSNSIVRVMGKSNIHDAMVVDDCISRNHFDIDELTPLTAFEWWGFAPWQDMKDAPLYVAIVVMLKNGKIQTTSLVAEIERDNYKKWMPLPTAQS